MAKYRLLREALSTSDNFWFEPAPLATADQIALVHDEQYISDFLLGSLDPRITRRIGFPWSEHLVKRTLASVGGTLKAAGDALEDGWGGTLAGGTHHAFQAEGSGFCVFNDIAIAIRSLRLNRVSVVDLDVHQGDGTAKIFADDPSVFTLSLHGRDNFPFRKQVSRWDVPLPDGTTDDVYLQALRSALPHAFEFRPSAVIYQSGVDGLASDRLGRLSLSHDGLRQRDELVFSACKEAGIPCVVTLGGGYSDPISLTVEAHRNTFETAARILGSATRSRPGC
ncbi:MAG: histone deacetylase [Bryobacteraceae bacterium]|nr:histone deacetylase [Bryobacteraceae bacterium]